MRDAMIATSHGFLRLSLEAYGCDEFPYWLRRTSYRVARCWENIIGLLEDGPWGMLAVMIQHRNEDRQQREYMALAKAVASAECLPQAA